MNFQPLSVARYGLLLAFAAAVMSAWLGHRAGATFDYALLRSIAVFIIFAVLGFGAEAVLTVGFQPPAGQPHQGQQPEAEDD